MFENATTKFLYILIFKNDFKEIHNLVKVLTSQSFAPNLSAIKLQNMTLCGCQRFKAYHHPVCGLLCSLF